TTTALMCGSPAAELSARHMLVTVTGEGPRSMKSGSSTGGFSGRSPSSRTTSTELSAITGGVSRNRRRAKNSRNTVRKTSATPVMSPTRNLTIAIPWYSPLPGTRGGEVRYRIFTHAFNRRSRGRRDQVCLRDRNRTGGSGARQLPYHHTGGDDRPRYRFLSRAAADRCAGHRVLWAGRSAPGVGHVWLHHQHPEGGMEQYRYRRDARPWACRAGDDRHGCECGCAGGGPVGRCAGRERRSVPHDRDRDRGRGAGWREADSRPGASGDGPY